MARIRSIKPGFASDSKVKRLSREARLMFLLMLPEADDEGRLLGSPKWLAGVLYPDDEDVTPKKAGGWLAEIVREGMVVPYEHDGTKYLWIAQFKRHQKPQHPAPSTLPPCPNEGEPLTRTSGEPPEPLTKPSGATHETFTPVVGEGEGVVVGEGVVAPAEAVDFEAFWSAYPRKTDRKAAVAAWPKATKKAAPGDLVAAALRYATDPNREDAYTLHPTTWLNRERWNDPPLPTRANGTESAADRTLRNLHAMRANTETKELTA